MELAGKEDAGAGAAEDARGRVEGLAYCGEGRGCSGLSISIPGYVDTGMETGLLPPRSGIGALPKLATVAPAPFAEGFDLGTALGGEERGMSVWSFMGMVGSWEDIRREGMVYVAALPDGW